MKKIIYFFIILFPAIAVSQTNLFKHDLLDYMWKYVGNSGFSEGGAAYTSIAFSPSGEPFVAFADGEYSQKSTVMKFNGTNWVTVGDAGFSPGRTTYVDLVFSPSGQPFVAFQDWANSLKATVMKFDGSSWVYVGTAGFSTGEAAPTSLAFSPSGEPFVAYADRDNSGKATVMKFNGNTWLVVGNSGFSTNYAIDISLAFDPSGDPYVAYGDCGIIPYSKLTVMKFDGNTWDTVGIAGFSTIFPSWISLAFNSSGEPYVAFFDNQNSGKVTVMKFDGANWQIVGNPGFSEGTSHYIDLAFSTSAVPYVVYNSYGGSSVMRFNGSNWEYVGYSGFSEGDAVYTSIAFSPSGEPFVAFVGMISFYESGVSVMTYDSVYLGIPNSHNSIFSTYPNPTSTSFTIKSNDINAIILNLDLFDIQGMKLLSITPKANQITIDIENYPAGIYFLVVRTDSTNIIYRVDKI
ncbi:MAG: T9SS C-terminal target domain-containing protein [Bacteroidetes bacterium]|nr:MAG: T9SS C-terminal target domain-containing protein [Bacteroidota bacterium]